jgi:hypothetical protein
MNISARRDGSSRFGANNLFHNFGSVAGAWIFSDEDFIHRTFHFLTFGKLKASYGTTGNDQIGDYQFMSLYFPVNYSVNYRGSSLVPFNIPNPYLQWEETKKFQFGIDLGFFSDLVLLNISYFKNRSSNQLLSYALPRVTGFPNIDAVNFPATVQNSGLELGLNVIPIRTSSFKWVANANITLPKNKLISFNNLSSSSYANSLFINEPITLQLVYHFVDVDPSTGLYRISDDNGNLKSTQGTSTDRIVRVNTAPKFYGGFQNTFIYKNFQLDILFQFVKQRGQNYFFGNYPGFYGTNQPVSILNSWKKPGDASPIQRYSASDFNVVLLNENAANSDAAWVDASYIRMKNASLSWQLPSIWKEKIHLQHGRLFLQGQNLLTITSYKGLDPENRSILSLPPLRVITIGIQFTL